MKPKTREQNFLAKIAGDANADTTMKPRTAEEYFLNQIAENGSSSLPSYSSSDIGKVLTVGEASPVETEVVVVPEQSVTYEGDAVLLSNAEGVASLNDGTSVVLSVNGQRYEGTLVKGNIRVEFETNKFYHVYKGKGTSVYFEAYDTAVPGHEGDTTPIRGTYTISATAVQSVTPSTTTVVVPEQTVTLTVQQGGQPGAVVLTGADFSSVSVGTVALMSVNGVTRTVTAVDPLGNGGIVFPYGDENNTAILKSAITGEIKFNSEVAGTYTVSLIASIPKAEPKWETPSAGGGALVIKATGEAKYSADDGYSVQADVDVPTLLKCFLPDIARPAFALFPTFISHGGQSAGYNYENPGINYMMPLSKPQTSVTVNNVTHSVFMLDGQVYLGYKETST